ncbi:hypothetical protein, partial [Klebsiella pneumoniae]|uniref:hypothetical protein n=1 Tax=Klebsiella pneumoniae TaxID=573 RepID=UPI00301380AD
LAFALEHFSRQRYRTVVFDRARFIGRHASSAEFYSRLLEHRPPGSRIVIASREPLPLRLTRFAPPHEIIVLHANDLAF